MIFKLQALSEIWTGDEHRQNSRLQMTSLLGSIRWWAEAYVRAFDVRACDPTDSGLRCSNIDPCFICQLFGGVGSGQSQRNAPLPAAARFSIRAWKDLNGQPDRSEIRIEPLHAGQIFWLEFSFLHSQPPLRSAQQHLLATILHIICTYASLGGKTTLKPVPGNAAGNECHRDYGLIQLLGMQGAMPDDEPVNVWKTRFLVEMQHRQKKQPNETPDLPRIDYFFFLPGVTLYESHPEIGSFNHLLGLDAMPWPSMFSIKEFNDGFDPLRAHVRGSRDIQSKRLFSFTLPAAINGRPAGRTWGYVLDPGFLSQIPDWLNAAGIRKQYLPDNQPFIRIQPALALAAGGGA